MRQKYDIFGNRVCQLTFIGNLQFHVREDVNSAMR